MTTTASAAHAAATDPESGHRMIMQFWPHLPPRQGDGGARAAVGALWSVGAPNPHTGTIWLRSQQRPTQLPAWVTAIGTTTENIAFTDGQPITGTVTVAAMKTPMLQVPMTLRTTLKAGATGTARPAGTGLCYRGNQVPVPTTELPAWATAKLQRAGATVEVDITATGTVVLPRHRDSYATATINFSGTISDPIAFGAAVAQGFGKAKAFGLGMILLR